MLKSLVVEHLRGSIVPFKLTFEKGKKLTVIFGENATGKTTISDALDLLGNGNVGAADEFAASCGANPDDPAAFGIS